MLEKEIYKYLGTYIFLIIQGDVQMNDIKL